MGNQSVCSSEEACSACLTPVDLRFFAIESKVDARGIGVGYGCLDNSEPISFLGFLIRALTAFTFGPDPNDDCNTEGSQTMMNWNGSQEVKVSQFGDIVVVGSDSWTDQGSNFNRVPCQEYYIGNEGPFPGECPYPCAPEGVEGAYNRPVPPLDYSANYNYKYNSKSTFGCSPKTAQNPTSTLVVQHKWNSIARNTVTSNREAGGTTTVNGNQDIGGIIPGTLNLGGNSGCTNSEYSAEDGGYSASSSVTLSNPVTEEYLAGIAKRAVQTQFGIRQANQAYNCNGDKCGFAIGDGTGAVIGRYEGEDACWFQLGFNNYGVPDLATYPTVPSKAKFRITAPKAQFDQWAIANTVNSISGKVYIYTAPYGEDPCCGGLENFNGRILSEQSYTITVGGNVMWEGVPNFQMYYADLGIEINGEGDQMLFAGETVNFCAVITGVT